MNRRWRIVFIASLLAFFMEYSLRGINGFLKQPAMAIAVFANYFIYLTLIEEFIGRFKLRDYQVWIVAQLFALLWQLLGVSGIYWPPFIFGINVCLLALNNVIWWPTIQTVFALHMARRVTPDVDRTRPLLSGFGIALFMALFVLVSASWRLLATPPIDLWQLLVMLTLTCFFAVISFGIFALNTRREATLATFERDRFLDGLALFTLGFLALSFFFLIDAQTESMHLINIRALIANILVSPLIALALLLRRMTSSKPIPI